MILNKLSLVNFKNYEQLEIELSAKINCFVGNNGEGKTNLLDAIYYLSLCKSFFNSADSQNIRYGHDFFLVQGEYELNDSVEKIYCGLKKGRKKIFKRNNKEYQKLAEHIGLLPVVMISPYDTVLITGGSEERRKFMNGVISQYNKEYLNSLINYNNVLSQRNKLLKDAAKGGYLDKDTISIYNEQLAVYGDYVFKCRSEFFSKLLPLFQEYYDFVSGANEKVSLEYKSHLHEKSFVKNLEESIDKDRVLQYTTRGIHKDDLVMNLEDHPIKKVGSQGQQKTYLISLKLAQFDFIKEIAKLKPILLLDDIFDKLDATRVEKFIRLVAENHFGQIFITDANKQRLDNIMVKMNSEHKLFEVDRGEANIL